MKLPFFTNRSWKIGNTIRALASLLLELNVPTFNNDHAYHVLSSAYIPVGELVKSTLAANIPDT
jgi:hypothetical protein